MSTNSKLETCRQLISELRWTKQQAEQNARIVISNPPFNVDKVDAEKIKTDRRLPFGLPGVNKDKKVSNGNYLWISNLNCIVLLLFIQWQDDAEMGVVVGHKNPFICVCFRRPV